MLAYIAGPIIGSIIGYCTNFIAVKMLFYPRREVRVFGHKLPFTPGVIPKGKDRLAGAIGDIVSNRLITKDDIESSLVNESTSSRIAEMISEGALDPIKDKLFDSKELIADRITLAIADTALKMDLTEFMVKFGTKSILESIDNPMLTMFLSPDLMESILQPVAQDLQETIYDKRDEFIKPAVVEKLTEYEDASIEELIENIDPELENMLPKILLSIMEESLGNILEFIDIEKIVKSKVDEMSVEELEEIVLIVMKKELNAIVNLGALIGLIIGLLTILF